MGCPYNEGVSGVGLGLFESRRGSEMRRANTLRLLSVFLVVVVAGIMLMTMPMHLGLDLQGGVHVVLEAQATEEVAVTSDIMERAFAVIDRRINAIGIAEPVIQREGARRIIVQLPGVSDHEQAIDTIGRTAMLEFQDPYGNTVITGSSLKDATLSQDPAGRWAVSIEFDSVGTQQFADLTRRWAGTGQPLPIIFDGEVVMTPQAETVIPDGKGIITGGFTVEEAREMALLLRSGALPVPLEVLEIRNVGPTLGQESIDQSLKAGVVGVLLVLLFMLVYYRLPGGLADIALAVYVILVLGTLVGMRAVLTLPGIGGLVLSVGMAVDANVIIFERVKEELAKGKRVRAAIQAGWKSAFRTILDSNLTTLITAFTLFYFGTGPVRGFAVTLTVGILISMFTAIVVTRMLIEFVMNRNPDLLARNFGAKGVASR